MEPQKDITRKMLVKYCPHILAHAESVVNAIGIILDEAATEDQYAYAEHTLQELLSVIHLTESTVKWRARQRNSGHWMR